ncbi:MAG: DNA repair protein RecN [Muribaculaceae bacterium]|nr:DNA repair protein RecN [Muribaculaceae bacterium]
MIRSLQISNYALIDSLELDFSTGFNIITGETGAGKSIMLGALGLLLGARAESRVIRRSDKKSVVEAVFAVSGNRPLAQWAARNDIEWDSDECILRREIAPGGRARAFINDSPVTLALLAEAGAMLIDIHSQHQNRLLGSPEFQREILDTLGGNNELLADYREKWSTLRKAEKELDAMRRSIESNRADEEFIRFRLGQLEDARLVAGEQEELESERELQANMTGIKQSLTDALDVLSNSDYSALTQISEAGDSLSDLIDVLDGVQQLAERLESARVEIQDIVETLSDFDNNLAADPRELEGIEERLAEIYSLEKRHKVDSVEALIAIRDDLHNRLSQLEDSDVAIADLERAVKSARKAAEVAAGKLTDARVKSAGAFASELTETARPLGMSNLNCEIAVDAAPLGPDGADSIEFRFAFNKNQMPIAVTGAASGGEISRLMLCIKSIVAGRLGLPTVVFDEVDTGVSGDVAGRMGEMMACMASEIQVVTITHLPQVAALGDSHFKVYKEDDAASTHTRVRTLTESERRAELALMLSGSEADKAALAAADTLLSRRLKK